MTFFKSLAYIMLFAVGVVIMFILGVSECLLYLLSGKDFGFTADFGEWYEEVFD